ncbi:MAG: EamA family transporter [Bacteroidota bacterium]
MVSPSRIILGYVTVCLVWGSTWLVIKFGVVDVTPMLAASIRLFIASVILFSIIQFRRIKIHWTKESRKLYVIIALTAYAIPFALMYWGSQYVPSGLNSLLFAFFPFAVAIFSFFMLPHERPTPSKIIGIVLGFIGLYWIFSSDIQITNSNTLYGMIAVIISATLNAYNIVYTKKSGQEISAFVLTFVPMFYSSILLLFGSFIFESYTHVRFTPTAVFSIMYLAILGSVIAFVSYYWLLKHLKTAIISFTAFITPIIALLLGSTIGGEPLSKNIFVGAIFVSIGIFIANFDELKRIKGKNFFD